MHHCIGLGDARIHALSLIVFLKARCIVVAFCTDQQSYNNGGPMDKTPFISQLQLLEQAFVFMPLFPLLTKNNSLCLTRCLHTTITSKYSKPRPIDPADHHRMSVTYTDSMTPHAAQCSNKLSINFAPLRHISIPIYCSFL